MAGCSWDSLGTKLSCDGTPLDDEDAGNFKSPTFLIFLNISHRLFCIAGIYNASYRAAAWAYIGETEELQVWQRQPRSSATPTADDPLQGKHFQCQLVHYIFKNCAFEFLVQNRTIRPRLRGPDRVQS